MIGNLIGAMPNPKSIINIVMLVFLAFLFVAIFWGVLWGTIRGFRRTWLRLASIVVSCILALLITPLISMMFVGAGINANIPGVGSFNDIMADNVFGRGVGADIGDAVGDTISFVQGVFAVVLNFFIFFFMFYLFKFISWVVYAIITMKVAYFSNDPAVRYAARNKRKEPKVGNIAPRSVGAAAENAVPNMAAAAPITRTPTTEIKRNRLAGAGLGVVVGGVLFAFLSIPLFGFISGLNKVASFNVEFGGSAAERTAVRSLRATDENPITVRMAARNMGLDISTALDTVPLDPEHTYAAHKPNNATKWIVDIQDGLTDYNKALQSTPITLYSKITGVSLLGDIGTAYLTNATIKKGKSINLRSDAIEGGKLAITGAAISLELLRSGSPSDKFESWTDKDYDVIKGVVDRIFGLGVVQSSLDYVEPISGAVLGDTLDKQGEKVNAEEGFKDDSITAIGQLSNAKALGNDIKQCVEIAKVLFAASTPTAKDSLLRDFVNISKHRKNNEELRESIDTAKTKLGIESDGTARTTSKVYKLVSAYYDLNVVRMLVNPTPELNITNIYTGSVKHYLDINGQIMTPGPKRTEWNSWKLSTTNLAVSVLNLSDLYFDFMDAKKDGGTDGIVDFIKNGINDDKNGNGEIDPKENDIKNVSNVLSALTNGNGIGTIVRGAILKFVFKDNFKSKIPGVETAVLGLRAEVESGSIDWEGKLTDIYDIVVLFADMFGSGFNFDLEQMFANGDEGGILAALVDMVAGNQWLAEVVTDVLIYAIADVTGDLVEGGLTITITPGFESEFVGIVGGVTVEILGAINDPSSLESGDFLETLKDLVEGLADLNAELETPAVVIDIAGALTSIFGDDAVDTTTGDMIDNVIDDKITEVFGAGYVDAIRLLFGLPLSA
jgi:hypothetical protein